ncbi:Zinc (Zn2)-Iron (Fe2) Permease (ZIP) Family [Phytophthora palmivora]|uniref:Zinc (Zn2)-Iron (Fe2) Permease (ZIP) Family n=1 Tax=Phytophthora palmivora TaxID=4796 RepID=A0A2P4X8R5_9STRA|nr:Zinc (Zn2)-Iron (Fe2) Permease (ZIP) Family [Phytophthora palmivora]
MSDERCCGCITTQSEYYDMDMHVGAIFIIFAVSMAGSLVPVIAQQIPHCSTNSIIMEAISAFAFGVVLATGLIHMVKEGIEKLSDECLGPIVEEYECLGLAIVLITMMLMHFIECESVVFFGSDGSSLHGHGHDHAGDVVELTISTRSNSFSSPHSTANPYQKKDVEKLAHNSVRRRMATIIFEAGVIFHSLVVGLDLGVTTGSEFTTLLTALCFHQFFEGVAVGSATLGSTTNRMKLVLLNFAFAITTPIGQAFGIAIHSTYSSSSTTALWVQGIFDCVAGGILLYTGLIELLTYNMTTNQKFLTRTTSQRCTLYICLWLGAGLMALIGKWA